MHMNRRKPAQGEDLADFLSGVVWDAIRDARAAGLSDAEIHSLLSFITAETGKPLGAKP